MHTNEYHHRFKAVIEYEVNIWIKLDNSSVIIIFKHNCLCVCVCVPCITHNVGNVTCLYTHVVGT